MTSRMPESNHPEFEFLFVNDSSAVQVARPVSAACAYLIVRGLAMLLADGNRSLLWPAVSSRVHVYWGGLLRHADLPDWTGKLASSLVATWLRSYTAVGFLAQLGTLFRHPRIRVVLSLARRTGDQPTLRDSSSILG